MLKNLLRQQVVEPFSGARYFGEPFKVPGSDHFSIAKPGDREAIQHRLLVQFIKSIVRPERSDMNEARPLLVLNILEQSIEALHYAPRQAEVRFKLADHQLDIKRKDAPIAGE